VQQREKQSDFLTGHSFETARPGNTLSTTDPRDDVIDRWCF